MEESIRLVGNPRGKYLELKPCPFCGSDIIFYEEYRHKAGNRWRVWCGDCLAGIDTGCAQSMGQAQEKWNRRTDNATNQF